MFFGETQAECSLDFPPDCICPISFLLAQTCSMEPWAQEKLLQLAQSVLYKTRVFPCFDTNLSLGISSPWQTWTRNAFAFSLEPSYKSWQCYSIPIAIKVYIGEVSVAALLLAQNVCLFLTFSLVCANCWCCLRMTFKQAVAPPPAQNRALAWINRANQKALLKVTFFFLYETECRKCALLFSSIDFFFLCLTIRISEIPGLLLVEHVLMVVVCLFVLFCLLWLVQIALS